VSSGTNMSDKDLEDALAAARGPSSQEAEPADDAEAGGQAEAAPPDQDKDAPPSDEATAPDDTASEDADDGTTSGNADDDTAPGNADEGTTPENADNDTAPGNADEGTTPEDADDDTAPEDVDDEHTEPKQEEEAPDAPPAEEPAVLTMEQRQSLWRASCIRWVLILLMAASWLLDILKPCELVAGNWLGLLVLGFAFLNILTMICARMGIPFSPMLFVAMDVAVATGTIHLTGGAQSRWFVAYLFPIIAATCCFDCATVLLASVSSALVYALYLSGNPEVPLTVGKAGLALSLLLLGPWGIVLREVLKRAVRESATEDEADDVGEAEATQT